VTVSGFIVWGYGVCVRLCMITIDNAGGLSYGPPVLFSQYGGEGYEELFGKDVEGPVVGIAFSGQY